MEKEKYFGCSKRITQWRDFNWLESLLARWADNSEYLKCLYVAYYKVTNRKYYKKGLEMIDKLISEHPELQLIPKSFLVRDMIYCLHRFGFGFDEYYYFELKDKSTACRNTFVSDKLRHYHVDILDEGADIELLFRNKVSCYNTYKEYFGRELVSCETEADYTKFQSFVKKNPCFMYKPMFGRCGRGIKIIELEYAQADSFFKKSIAEGPFVAEEIIKQGRELAILHPQSINTVRVHTFVIDKRVHVVYSVLRMGRGLNVVDNGAAGGLIASIDYETGIVTTGGKGECSTTAYNFHPDTHAQIVGIQLPQWNQLKQLVNSAALKVEGTVSIGWDIAFSDKGWVIVEGNYDGGVALPQLATGRGIKPIMNSCMDKFFTSK
jgi:hypothetical protein